MKNNAKEFISEILIQKIDFFMQKNIVPNINPNDIFWWFSLSGGKDSFTMAYALYLWYEKNHFRFQGEGLYIKQWGETGIFNHLTNSIDWMPVTKINGEEETLRLTNYKPTEQAPCSLCSNVRKKLGDKYITENFKEGLVNVISRGLHLTDMAISYLWRNFCGIDTIEFANSLKKGRPFEKLNLFRNIYLAKPLCYVREFECEQFAKAHNYLPICCGCPVCRYPSRRDIVEESLSLFFHNDLWEFDIFGVNCYLNAINAPEKLKELSLPGKESKCFRLSTDFCSFALEYWRARQKTSHIDFSKNNYLDDIGYDYLVNHMWCFVNELYLPKFFSDEILSHEEQMMIATVGPFWGAAGYYDSAYKEYVFALQSELFGISINQLWSQVNPILQDYYKNKSFGNNIILENDFQNRQLDCNSSY